MGYQEKWDSREKTHGHPPGAQWCPKGDILIYAWKSPFLRPNEEKGWELVERTNRKVVADRVEEVWKRNGFKTKRETE